MDYWKWGPELELGIDVIDNQHRRIVDYLNMLHDARDRNDPDKVGTVLNELVDYTITHFAFEESMMAQSGYTLVGPHKQVHDRFTQMVHHYVEQHRNGVDITKELLSALRVWLTNHIHRDDRDYVATVKRNMNRVEQSGWLGKALKKFFG
jgi:hemerythrin